VRISGDTIVLIPSLIANDGEIGRMVEGTRAVLEKLS
jgi:adenosylmethionine-8-amino-7-oxononanoate aminotransferase